MTSGLATRIGNEAPGRGPARASQSRAAATVAVAAAVLVVSVLVAATLGPAHIAAADVARTVAAHLGWGAAPLPQLQDGIVWQIRLPRVLTAAAAGAGLAVCGVVLQGVLRNPLAEPYVLGLSSGASLGAVGVLVLGLGVALAPAAFLGALGALGATLALSGATRGIRPERTVLAGLAVAQFCSALTSLAIFWSAAGDSYREILSWLMGSLGGATWTSVAVAGGATAVVGTALAASGRTLDTFAFGDTAAAALGVPVHRARGVLLAGVALLTGALVSQTGAIGFVGLLLPHAVRLLVGSRNRIVLPIAALTGASFLVWADTAARAAFAPRELPVGILTAAAGAPAFAWVLLRRRAAS